MNLSHPRVLWMGSVLLPLLALFLWATWRKRQALVRMFVQNKTLVEMSVGVSTGRQKLRRVLLFIGVILLLGAMAGPQWGFTWEETNQRGRDIVVAIDTSRSMLATDIQPDRLTRAKLAALDLLKLGQFDRFGLIAFSGSAFLQCPLTFDDGAFRQSVQILEPGIIPQGGTALSEAIDAAREAYGTDAEDNHKILILFTDGEDHEANVMDAVDRATAVGIRIFTVGVGTPAGELLRVQDDRGNLVYVKDDEGNVVKSRLNEKLLQQIATQAKGFYVALQGGNAMEMLYQRGLAPLPAAEHSTKLMKRLKEQYYWPLAAGILILMLEIFVPDQKRSNRASKPQLQNASGIPAAAALLLLCLGIPVVHASAAKAQRHYKAGEYKSALSEYQELIAKDPNDPRLRYNAGAAAYSAGKFDEAQKEFQAAAAARDLDLQEQSFYNLANSEFRVGESIPDPKERMASWEQALQHYEAALKIDPKDGDAEFNRDVVRKKLEELKKQQQQQNKDEKKNDKNDSDKKEDNKDQNKEQKDQQNKDQQQKDNKSDQQGKEDKEQQQKQDNQKKDQQKQGEEKKEQQQKQQEQQQSQAEKDKEKANQSQASQGGQKESDQQKKDAEAAAAAQMAQLGKMTPAQARQLLDAQRDEEKALLFIPPNQKKENQSRTFKDW